MNPFALRVLMGLRERELEFMPPKTIKRKKKKVRPGFNHKMAAATSIKRRNGGCCR
jgi:hypothetical protein